MMQEVPQNILNFIESLNSLDLINGANKTITVGLGLNLVVAETEHNYLLHFVPSGINSDYLRGRDIPHRRYPFTDVDADTILSRVMAGLDKAGINCVLADDYHLIQNCRVRTYELLSKKGSNHKNIGLYTDVLNVVWSLYEEHAQTS